MFLESSFNKLQLVYRVEPPSWKTFRICISCAENIEAHMLKEELKMLDIIEQKERNFLHLHWNQHRAKANLARADVVQIINLGHHDRALIRVEQVIKEQNMLDVFVMIEGYCNLLAERINLLKKEKVCPEELEEAISGILYASTRCGEFPELIEIRAIFTSRFGKEFAARAIELRNNCGVNPRMIQKLSTRQPLLETRLKVLKEIAAENNIVLKFEDDYSIAAEENVKKEHELQPEVSENLSGLKAGEAFYNFTPNMEETTDLIQVRRKYKDVADAAQAAYQSAAYAAAAARMAVKLSKSENHDSDDHNNHHKSGRRREGEEERETTKSKVQPTKQSSFLRTIKDQTEGEDEEMQCDFDESDDEKGGDDTEAMNLDNEMDRYQKRYPLRSGAGAKQKPELVREKRPVSVRTRF